MSNKAVLLKRLTGNHQRLLRDEGGEVLLSTVSGVVTTTGDMIRAVDRDVPGIDVITSKSYQVEPNPGNREPIITEPKTGCFGNSVGLRNPGMEAAYQELDAVFRGYAMRGVLNISVSASTPEDFITLVRFFGGMAEIIELNFSCPHASAGYGSTIGESAEIAAHYMGRIREDIGPDFPAAVFPKLTPNVDNIREIAAAVMDAGADGFSAINTVGPECYIEPFSGKPILQNDLGGRGGMSGEWVKQKALATVSAMRETLGRDVPIIGMGGVTTAEDAAAMAAAGADVVGIGSAFARVKQWDWAQYIDTVKAGAREILHSGCAANSAHSSFSVDHFLSKSPQMNYEPYRISRIEHHSRDVYVVSLEGERSYKAGEYVFLWIPGVGEKPFSIAEASPLRFVIKKKGPFTEALCAMQEGESLYLRGLYGAPVDVTERDRAVLLAGGTGIAVLPALAEELTKAGKNVSIFYGAVDDAAAKTAPLQEILEQFGPMKVVQDEGKPGRVIDSALCSATEKVPDSTLDSATEKAPDSTAGKVPDSTLDSANGKDPESTAVYIVGPEKFMAKAAEAFSAAGVPQKDVYLSMERPSLCGIGMCGACSCGGHLTCQYGTFLRMDFLMANEKEFFHD
ncbi:MAG: dihydroorotate dehydrogenase [Spirochaetales bacterium]|nr:dihydroorotate dehydrogenase [Spirochaetales bacterium]